MFLSKVDLNSKISEEELKSNIENPLKTLFLTLVLRLFILPADESSFDLTFSFEQENINTAPKATAIKNLVS